MAASELLADFGLRLDGRKCDELRQINCKLGVYGQADGSSYLEQGNTKILAAVYGKTLKTVPLKSFGFKLQNKHDLQDRESLDIEVEANLPE